MAPEDRSPEDREAARLRDAAASLQRAVHALEAVAAAESTSSGRRAVYAGWASHLANDWRGVALLAARAGVIRRRLPATTKNGLATCNAAAPVKHSSHGRTRDAKA
jgi:hypothetical protein